MLKFSRLAFYWDFMDARDVTDAKELGWLYPMTSWRFSRYWSMCRIFRVLGVAFQPGKVAISIVWSMSFHLRTPSRFILLGCLRHFRLCQETQCYFCILPLCIYFLKLISLFLNAFKASWHYSWGDTLRSSSLIHVPSVIVSKIR